MTLEKNVESVDAISHFFDYLLIFSPFFCQFFLNCFLWRQNEWKGIYMIRFRILVKESESVETSPGFPWLLGENWVFKVIYI